MRYGFQLWWNSTYMHRIQLNNFILRWYCTIAEANQNQPLITINMVKIYHVEADTKVISMWQPYTAMNIPH